MKNRFILFSTILSTLFLLSCGTSTSDGNNQGVATDTGAPTSVEGIKEKVMNIHDEAMGKMGTIMNLKESLDKIIAGKKDLTTDQTEQVYELKAVLNKADKAMMDWMHNYKESSDTTKMLMELRKITRVKEMMNISIKNAKEFIANYEKSK